MIVEQLKFKLNETVSSQTRSECTLYCHNLQEATIGYIYDKTTGKKTKNASLLEMLDNAVVTFYINDTDIVNFLHYVRILGMNAKHDWKVRKKEVKETQDNVTYLIRLLAVKETGIEYAYHKPPYMSETATRKLDVDYMNSGLRST